MFVAAYLVARWLWLPLLVLWFAAPSAPARRWLVFPIAVAIAATAYEALIPVQMNIRLDLMLVVPMLVFAEALAGVGLAAALFARRKRGAAMPSALVAAAALCLGAPLGLAVAWEASKYEADRSYREHVEGNRYRFEAAFRDDATQLAAFGDLRGGRWAGYYSRDSASAGWVHLVVNAAGEFWVFTKEFYERRGRGGPDPADEAVFKGADNDGIHEGTFSLRDLGGGRLSLLLRDRYGNRELKELVFAKATPPRFPRAASPGDQVRFKGVFAARSGKGGGVQVAQLWLWESDGWMWGKYFRQGFTAGVESPVVRTRDARLKCASSDCSSMVLTREDDGPITLTWLSPDRLREGREGDYSSMIYERGEVIPGFLYHLAPLATVDENRKWLRSMHHAPSWMATAP